MRKSKFKAGDKVTNDSIDKSFGIVVKTRPYYEIFWYYKDDCLRMEKGACCWYDPFWLKKVE